ncbi:MAG: pyridoxamine 5'-phosphate oxidase [Ignavibacteriaceae bacterium]|nr:pyridoxamine 5'-phosphate oxidase [Ignavibacteriaceae bacterium]
MSKQIKQTIAELRSEYKSRTLDISDVSQNPFEMFDKWFTEAIKSGISEANAMALATSSPGGIPSVRTVLLKDFNREGFVFFTNYESKKGKDIFQNPKASVLFFWKELERQVRISGSVKKTSRQESEEYFNLRPMDTRIGAWASAQSKPISSRSQLEEKFRQMKEKFNSGPIPLPDFWGGYRIIPNEFEFWQGRINRLHDRIYYKKKRGYWQISRLNP